MTNSAQSFRIYSAQPVIIGGFVALLLLLVALFAVWYQSVEENKHVLATTAHLQTEMQLIYQIRDGANRRAVFLLHMAQITDDPFLVDEEYLRFKEAAGPFLIAREKLLGPGASENVLRLWEKAAPFINKGGSVQIKVAQLLLNDELAEAQDIITKEVLPTQDQVMLALDDILNAQEKLVNQQLSDVQEMNHRTDIILLVLAGVIFILGLSIAAFVTRRSAQSENQLREHGNRIRSLYDVSSLSGLSFDEQIIEMLRLGCQLTEMQTGSLLKIDLNNNAVISTINIDRQANDVIGDQLLESQICAETLQSTTAVTVELDAENQNQIPKNNGVELFTSYIGIALNVHGKLFGVLNFISNKPRNKAFTDIDKDLIFLIGSWMSVTLERVLEESELAEAKNIAESANQAKSSFIANMSHEIRTPLTAIIGFANSLLDPSRSDREHNDAAHTIIRSSEHLHDLINDILDLSKIEAGQLVLEKMPISPLAIVTEVESLIAPHAREKGLNFRTHVDFPIPETIVSDPTRLKQILLNLCSNATKFTSMGEISIRTAFDVLHRQLVFTITDTGIGMDSQELTQIFQPFAQADTSTTRRFGGTGLGLWISRQLAQRLGGDIICESEKGKGSTFQVRLTIAEDQTITLTHENIKANSATKPSKSKTEEPVPQLNGHILLAEDSPDIQVLVKFVIKKTGAEITIVDNGKKAVEHALGGNFDLILMDMQMPEMGGIEATQWLRNAGYSGPIVALTANAMKEDEEQSRATGFDNYLTKPLVIERFYATLSEHLLENHGTPDSFPIDHSIDNSSISHESDFLDDEYRELVGLFIQHLQTYVNDIELSVKNNDWELMQNISHKLKGSGSAFGYPKITELASHVNDYLQKDFDVAENKDFNNAIIALDDYCKTILLNYLKAQ